MTYVDLNLFFPWGMLVQTVRAVILFNFTQAFLKNKVNGFVTFLAIVGSTWVYGAWSLSFSAAAEYEVLLSVLYYALIFVVTALCTHGKLFGKAAVTVFASLSYSVSSFFTALIFSLSGIDAQIFAQYNIPLSILLPDLLVVFVLSLLYIALAKLLYNKFVHSFSTGSKYIFLLFSAFSHIVTSYIYVQSYQILDGPQHAQYTALHPYADTVNTVLLCLCFIFDFFTFMFIIHLEKIESKNAEMERALLKNQLDYQQTAMLTEEKKEFRKIKHDFSNILTTVQGYIEIGKPEKALSVLQNTYTDLTGLAGFSVCSNKTVNTILYMKTQQAKECGVTLTTEITEECSVKIDDYDLCRLLANILDNALNAAALTDTAKFALIRIRITETDIHIHSENGFVQTVHKIKKSDIHGNGVGIIKEIAKNYSGSYKAYSKAGLYYTDTVFENRILSKRKTSSYS